MPLPSKRRRSLTDLPARSGEEIRFAVSQTSLGAVLGAFSEKGIVSIMFRKDRDELIGELQQRYPKAHLVPGDRSDREVVARVVRFVEKPVRDLDLPLDIQGTPFQRRVWRAVREVPLGETATYSEIARRIGSPRAMRAVGNACSNCLLALAIPCHRILRSDGSFSGRVHRQGVMISREKAALAGSKG